MVKSGKKVALAFLGGYAIAQLLFERGYIDDPSEVYVWSALLRDVLMVVPDIVEKWLEDKADKAWMTVKKTCGRHYGDGNRRQDEPDDPSLPQV